MGIDIYARWSGITEDEQASQYTGFSVEAGDVGYLREAYHGGPYATQALLPETWESEGWKDAPDDDPRYEGVEVDGATLMSRLTVAVIAALIREAVVYREQTARDLLNEIGIEPSAPKPPFESESEASNLISAVTFCMREALSLPDMDLDVPEPQEKLDPEWMRRVVKECAMAKSLIDFTTLVIQKERETGKPVRIINSY